MSHYRNDGKNARGIEMTSFIERDGKFSASKNTRLPGRKAGCEAMGTGAFSCVEHPYSGK